MRDINFFKTENSFFLKEVHGKNEVRNCSCDGFLIDAKESECRRIVESLKKEKKIIAVLARDSAFNRRAVETLKINYLVFRDNPEEKFSLKQADSGINHVIAKISHKKNIFIVIDANYLSSVEDKKQRARLIRKIIQNAKICRKEKCKIKIASFGKNPEEVFDERERMAIGFSLGMSSEQARDCVSLSHES
jgi:RNase P/RNase MRP subunit p30